MGALTAGMARYEQQLTDAGIRATTDPRNLNPPCVIIGPPSLVLDLACGGTATVTAYVVGTLPANLDAWRAVDDLAERVGRILPVEAIAPTGYQAEPAADPLPAYQLTWTAATEWPAAE